MSMSSQDIPGYSEIVKTIKAYGEPLCLSIGGSHAYGLDTEDSDYDLIGCFRFPTANILSIYKYDETLHKANKKCPHCDESAKKDCSCCLGTGFISDYTFHEVGKLFDLATSCNPAILEMFYIEPVLKNEIWDLIVENRDMFLSTRLRASYGGYAKQQLAKKKLREEQGMEGYSPKTRYRDKKHTRHIVRLFLQERQLLTYGEITPFLSDKEKELCLDAQNWNSDKLKTWMDKQTLELLEINNNIKPVPDYKRINRILLEIRGL